jgi:hypothetical protein
MANSSSFQTTRHLEPSKVAFFISTPSRVLDSWTFLGWRGTMLEIVIGGVLVLFIGWVARKGWVKIRSPIDHLDEEMENWSTEDRKKISDAGYDLTKLVWVIDYDIPSTRYKPVLIPRWLFKVEVHLPRKVEYAQLFEKP